MFLKIYENEMYRFDRKRAFIEFYRICSNSDQSITAFLLLNDPLSAFSLQNVITNILYTLIFQQD